MTRRSSRSERLRLDSANATRRRSRPCWIAQKTPRTRETARGHPFPGSLGVRRGLGKPVDSPHNGAHHGGAERVGRDFRDSTPIHKPGSTSRDGPGRRKEQPGESRGEAFLREGGRPRAAASRRRWSSGPGDCVRSSPPTPHLSGSLPKAAHQAAQVRATISAKPETSPGSVGDVSLEQGPPPRALGLPCSYLHHQG